MYNLILAAECLVAFSAIVGPPDLKTWVTGCLAFAAALLGSTVAGNFVSAALPVARDISKIGNSPSQTGIFVSFVMLLANVVLIGGSLAIAALAGVRWLQPVLLALLFAVHVVVYGMSLGPAAAMLERRKEALIEASRVPS
jgi:hypothetical protein